VCWRVTPRGDNRHSHTLLARPGFTGRSFLRYKAYAPTFSLDSHNGVIDFVRHGVEGIQSRYAAKDVNFVESYKKGKLRLVVQILTGWGLPKYDFIFFVVPLGGEQATFAAHYKPNGAIFDAFNSHWNNEFVFMEIAEVV
jgi:hypothetical protein